MLRHSDEPPKRPLKDRTWQIRQHAKVSNRRMWHAQPHSFSHISSNYQGFCIKYKHTGRKQKWAEAVNHVGAHELVPRKNGNFHQKEDERTTLLLIYLDCRSVQLANARSASTHCNTINVHKMAIIFTSCKYFQSTLRLWFLWEAEYFLVTTSFGNLKNSHYLVCFSFVGIIS